MSDKNVFVINLKCQKYAFTSKMVVLEFGIRGWGCELVMWVGDVSWGCGLGM